MQTGKLLDWHYIYETLMQMFTRFLLPLVALFLVSCEASNPNELSLKELEGAEGEAVVRGLIQQLPEIDAHIPKVYTPVCGANLSSMNMDFIRRLSDLKLTFISGEVLKMSDPDKSIVDPRSGLSPIILQVMSITRKGENRWDVMAAWAYKKTFERSRYLLKKDGERYELLPVERIEGNFQR